MAVRDMLVILRKYKSLPTAVQSQVKDVLLARMIDVAADVSTQSIQALTHVAPLLGDVAMCEVIQRMSSLLISRQAARPQAYELVNDDGSTNRPVYDSYIQGLSTAISLSPPSVLRSVIPNAVPLFLTTLCATPASNKQADVETQDNINLGVSTVLQVIFRVAPQPTLPPLAADIQKIAQHLLDLLNATREPVRVGAANCLGPLAAACSKETLNFIVKNLASGLMSSSSSSASVDTMSSSSMSGGDMESKEARYPAAFLKATVSVAQHASDKLGSLFDTLMHALVTMLQPALRCEEAPDSVQLMWADALQALSSLVTASAYGLGPHMDTLIKLTCTLASYDPLYEYDDDAERGAKSMGDAPTAAASTDDDGWGDDSSAAAGGDDGWGDDAGGSNDGGWGDEASSSGGDGGWGNASNVFAAAAAAASDSSRLVRSQAAKLACAVIAARTDLLPSIFPSYANAFSHLLREHDAMVLRDIMSVLQQLVSQAASVLAAPPAPFTLPPFAATVGSWLENANPLTGKQSSDNKTGSTSSVADQDSSSILPPSSSLGKGTLVREPSMQAAFRPMTQSLTETLPELIPPLTKLLRELTDADALSDAYELVSSLIRAMARKGFLESSCPLSPYSDQLLRALCEVVAKIPSATGARALVSVLQFVPHADSIKLRDILETAVMAVTKSKFREEVLPAVPLLVLLLRAAAAAPAASSTSSIDVDAALAKYIRLSIDLLETRDTSLALKTSALLCLGETVAAINVPLLADVNNSAPPLQTGNYSTKAIVDAIRIVVHYAVGHDTSAEALNAATVILQHQTPTAVVALLSGVGEHASAIAKIASAGNYNEALAALRFLHFFALSEPGLPSFDSASAAVAASSSSSSSSTSSTSSSSSSSQSLLHAVIESQIALATMKGDITNAQLSLVLTLLAVVIKNRSQLYDTTSSFSSSSTATPLPDDAPEYSLLSQLLPLVVKAVGSGSDDSITDVFVRLLRVSVTAAKNGAALVTDVSARLVSYFSSASGTALHVKVIPHAFAAMLVALPSSSSASTRTLTVVLDLLIAFCAAGGSASRVALPSKKEQVLPFESLVGLPLSILVPMLLSLASRAAELAPLPLPQLSQLLAVTTSGAAAQFVDESLCSKLFGHAAISQPSFMDVIIKDLEESLKSSLNSSSTSSSSSARHGFLLRVVSDAARSVANRASIRPRDPSVLAGSAIAASGGSTQSAFIGDINVVQVAMKHVPRLLDLMFRHSTAASSDVRNRAATVIGVLAIVDPARVRDKLIGSLFSTTSDAASSSSSSMVESSSSSSTSSSSSSSGSIDLSLRRLAVSTLRNVFAEVSALLDRSVSLANVALTPAGVTRQALLSMLHLLVRHMPSLVTSDDLESKEAVAIALTNLLQTVSGAAVLRDSNWGTIFEPLLTECTPRANLIVKTPMGSAFVFEDPTLDLRTSVYMLIQRVLLLVEHSDVFVPQPVVVLRAVIKGLKDFDPQHSLSIMHLAARILVDAARLYPHAMVAVADQLVDSKPTIVEHYGIVKRETEKRVEAMKNAMSSLPGASSTPPLSPELVASRDVLRSITNVFYVVKSLRGAELQSTFWTMWTSTMLKSQYIKEIIDQLEADDKAATAAAAAGAVSASV